MNAKELLKMLIEASDTAEVKVIDRELVITEPKPIKYKYKVGDKIELAIPPYGVHEITGIAEGIPTPHYKLSYNGNTYYQEDVLTIAKSQDITDRIKTFEDACKWCEQNNKMQLIHEHLLEILDRHYTPDLLAYLKLRIITAALNEGWEPTFAEDELRYYCICDADGGALRVVSATKIGYITPYTLYFKTRELALYAATQFADIYADFCGCKKGGEE